MGAIPPSSASSSRSSAPSAARGSPWCPAIRAAGCGARSPTTAPRRSSAWTPSTSSSSPPTPSMRYAARSGGRHASARTPPARGGSRAPAGRSPKAPERLTGRQQAKLATIQQTNQRLYRAYLLKEQLRVVFHEASVEGAIEMLDAWVVWAQRSRLPSFVKLAATIRADREAIVASLTHRLSNARMEAANTTIRLITRRAFGFHSAEALIALAMLTLGGLCPPLPGRSLT